MKQDLLEVEKYAVIGKGKFCVDMPFTNGEYGNFSMDLRLKIKKRSRKMILKLNGVENHKIKFLKGIKYKIYK